MNFTLKKSDLNFKVYIVAAKPTAPGAENDIAIISSVPMTNWIMSPDKPSGIPRNDGDVWIQYSTSGDTFNALKQNAMMIATISAWQYVDGAWVDRDAVSCQGGAWVDWFPGVYLFNAGNQHTDLTGGWTTSNVSNSTTTFGETIVSDCRYNGALTSWSHVVTKNKIDVTNYKKLYFDVAVTQRNQSGFSDIAFGIVAEQGSDNYVSKFLSEGNNMPDLIDTIEVDLNGISGSYYVQMGTSNTHVEIKRVWARVR